MAQQNGTSNLPEQISTISEKWCNTKYKFTKCVYKWMIDDFRAKLTFADEAMISTPFNEEFPRKLQWQLTFRTDSYFGVVLLKGDGSSVSTAVEFAILNPQGGKDHVATQKYTFNEQNKTAWFSLDRDAVLRDTKKLIYGDQLTVRVVISIANGMTNDSGSIQTRRDEASANLPKDVGRMLEKESFSDVTLIVGSESLRAHKVVLAARSEVFAAMFQHEMVESSKNCVTIADIKPEVLRETLRFVYTGEVSDSVLKKMALALIAAADKYALGDLKDLCEDFLMQSLCPETAAETLIVADLHGADRLKTQSIDFINANIAEVALTAGWFEIPSYAHLMEVFATKQKKTEPVA